MDMKEMKLLSEWSYEPAKIHRGYAERHSTSDLEIKTATTS